MPDFRVNRIALYARILYAARVICKLFENLHPSWQNELHGVLNAPELVSLASFLEEEALLGHEIYPPYPFLFHAFALTPYERVRVVIMGQDPYHGEGQAHGLCFSVPNGVHFPPSLLNIFKEIQADLHLPMPNSGCLIPWAKQGVLLLNATLTVRKGTPLSHQGKGWEFLTDAVIAALCRRADPVIFVLWGKSAQEKCRHIPCQGHHFVLQAAHPSPFSAYRGFLGCRHFSKINEILVGQGKSPIDWCQTT